jgi:hypothetical protein
MTFSAEFSDRGRDPEGKGAFCPGGGLNGWSGSRVFIEQDQ